MKFNNMLIFAFYLFTVMLVSLDVCVKPEQRIVRYAVLKTAVFDRCHPEISRFELSMH